MGKGNPDCGAGLGLAGWGAGVLGVRGGGTNTAQREAGPSWGAWGRCPCLILPQEWGSWRCEPHSFCSWACFLWFDEGYGEEKCVRDPCPGGGEVHASNSDCLVFSPLQQPLIWSLLVCIQLPCKTTSPGKAVGLEMWGRLVALALWEQPVHGNPSCVHSPQFWFCSSLFDSPAERYVKARQSVQRFTLVQLGKCGSDTESDFPRSYR